jgi:hypothetical protein
VFETVSTSIDRRPAIYLETVKRYYSRIRSKFEVVENTKHERCVARISPFSVTFIDRRDGSLRR